MLKQLISYTDSYIVLTPLPSPDIVIFQGGVISIFQFWKRNQAHMVIFHSKGITITEW